MKNMTFTTRLLVSALLTLVLPLCAQATDVVVADANGNQLTYSYETADGPATFKAVKAYASDEEKLGRIVIADYITDDEGNTHAVKYVGGNVGNRSKIVSIVFGQNIVATGGPDGSSRDAFSGCGNLVSVTLNKGLEILGTYTFLNCYAMESINLGDCTNLTTIGASAVEDCDHVRSLTIPASVTTIEQNAFYSIDSLRTITFAEGSRLATLGDGAFRNNTMLESINIEACTQLTNFPNSIFYNCPSLKSMTVPASVETFGNWMFDYTNNIEALTFLAPSVPRSFYSGRKQLKTLNIGPGVKRIDNSAFSSCMGLNHLNISDDVDGLVIGEWAFSDCDSLPSVHLPAGVSGLEDYAFYSIDFLTSFTFAEGSRITEIPRQCFHYCWNLESIKLPDAVQKIGYRAFWYCYALKEVTFGTGLIDMGSDPYPFGSCDRIEKIVFPGTTYPFTTSFYVPADAVLYVHPGLVESYRTTDYTKNYRIMAIGSTTDYAATTTAGGQLQEQVPEEWAQYALSLTVRGPINGSDINYLHSAFPCLQVLNLADARIVAGGDKYNQWDVAQNGTATVNTWYGPWDTEDDVVGYAMFYNMPSLKSLSLPKGTKKIGDYAIAQDRRTNLKLTSCDIPSEVTEIGHHAFYYTGITQITVPSGVTRLEEYTFWNCQKLQKATLPDGITFIGNSCFSEDYELQDVNIPAHVETIDQHAFYHNYKRSTPIVIPASCKSIGYRAFAGNRVVPSITVSDGVETVGSYAFAECYLIKECVLPETVTRIGDRAFYNCDSLRTFTFPQQVKQVEGWTFESCDALESVTLAPGTTSIGESAFNGCRRLTRINLTEQTELTTLDNYAFVATGLKEVTLPNLVSSIGWAVFQDCNDLERINVPTGIDYVPYDYCEGSERLHTVEMHDGIRTIRHDAFYGCDSLQNIVLNDQITSIEYNAFCGCQKLALTKLPDNLTSLGNSAFSGTASMKGTLVIPAGVTELPYRVFYGSGIEAVVLHDGITTFGNDVFCRCYSLKSAKLPANLTRIANYMFQYCYALEQIDLPESVTEIGYGAFDNSGLTSIELPENVQKIEDYAFSNSKLRTFRVPDGFTDALGSYALQNCDSLRTAYMGRNEDYTQYSSFTIFNSCDSLRLLRVYAGTPPSTDTWNKNFRFNCVLEVPEGTIALYQAADMWKDFKEIREFYSGDELREQDFAVMQALYDKLNGASWAKVWNMENNRHAANKWAGVSTMQIGTTTQYAITGLDLSDMGLTGELPQELFRLKNLTTLNLSHNHIRGDAGQIIGSIAEDRRAPLTDVNLQGNELTGDAYAIASALPALTKLNLTYNQLTDVSQVIPKETLTDLTLEMQFIDWETKQTVAAAADVAQDLTAGVAADIELPATFTYRHSEQDFGYNPTSLSRPYCTNFNQNWWNYTWELAKSDGQWNMDAYDDRVLRAPKNQPVAYVADWRTVVLRFTWEDGDVNADQTVDVTDLQSVVNFAFNERKYNGELFNFADADCNGDNVINVSDIVGNVEHILAYTPDATSLARDRNKVQANINVANVLSMDGADLTLHNTDAVAAMQLTIAGATQRDITVNRDLSGRFTVVMRQTDDGLRIVIYSAARRTLQPGDHKLLSGLPAGATIANVCLSDAEAHYLGFSIDDEPATTIGQLTATDSRDMQVYDLNGRRLGSWQSLPGGIYVVHVNGKQYKVNK